MQDFQGGKNLTEIWNAITNEFINGWPSEGPSDREKELVDLFLGSERYDELMIKFYNEEINQFLGQSYSNNTKVTKLQNALLFFIYKSKKMHSILTFRLCIILHCMNFTKLYINILKLIGYFECLGSKNEKYRFHKNF